jgi:hypothetical protein
MDRIRYITTCQLLLLFQLFLRSQPCLSPSTSTVLRYFGCATAFAEIMAHLPLLFLALLSVTSACPVRYRGDGLLFGGVGDRCVSGCQPRSSEVARTCGFRGQQDDVWGLCTAQQRMQNLRKHLCSHPAFWFLTKPACSSGWQAPVGWRPHCLPRVLWCF